MIRVLLALHLACAGGATVLFWTAAITRKAGATHRTTGGWFGRLIYAAAITGGLLAAAGLLDPDALPAARGGDAAATRRLMWFVLYLLVVIVAPVQHGLAVIAAGAAPMRVRSRLHASLSLAAIVGAVVLLPAALIWRTWPFLLAVPAGFAIGLRNMAYAGLASADPARWQREHLTSLISAGIALHTAFFVLAAGRWPIPPSWGWAPWLGPALIGLPVVARLRRTWQARTSPVGPVRFD